jgi:branched-chain amino acid transport system substrate-binding protein
LRGRNSWFLALALICAACAAPRPLSPPRPKAPESRVKVEQSDRRPGPETVSKSAPDALAIRTSVETEAGSKAASERAGPGAGPRGGSGTEAEKIERARALEEAGRNEEAIGAIGLLGPTASYEAWLIRGRALEAVGRTAEAVTAYGRAIEASPPRAGELNKRVVELIDTLGVADLRKVSDACPLCPEGGYARLSLARFAIDEGRLEEARAALRDLAADFAGFALGDAASALEQEVAPRPNVRPGLYGVLLPLSGPLRPFGTRALRGALIGSGLFSVLPDPGIRLAVADSEGDPSAAAQAVEDLARRGVMGIVGPLKGSVAVEAARAARPLGVPLLALTPAPEVTAEGAFRLQLREEDEVARLVQYATTARGMRRFAILYPNTALGRRYRDLFWDEAVRQGGEIAGVEVFSPGGGGIGSAIEKLTGVYGLTRSELWDRFLEEERAREERAEDAAPSAAAGAASHLGKASEIADDEARFAEYKPRPIVDFDAVFLPVTGLEAAQIAPQFAFHDVDRVVLLGVRTWNYPTLVQVGGGYVENALFPGEFAPDMPFARDFTHAYQQAYGEAPGVVEAYAFDAVNLLFRLQAGGGPETREALRSRLLGLREAEGATGPLSARADGNICTTPRIFTVRRGQIVLAP